MNTINPIKNISLISYYGHQKGKSEFLSTTIHNFHCVDDTLLRGAKPNCEQLTELKNHGVNNIISFCTYHHLNTKQSGALPKEAEAAKKLGMNFYWFPFRSKENPPEDYIKNFFKIIENVKRNKEKIFIHCRHGADRTGLFSALYRLKYKNVKLSEIIKELMEYGHNANKNPNIIPFIIKFQEDSSFINKIKKLLGNLLK